MQSFVSMIMVPIAGLSERSEAFECILGERVAKRPCTTECTVSFNSGDDGSESSATCSIEAAVSITRMKKTKDGQ